MRGSVGCLAGEFSRCASQRSASIGNDVIAEVIRHDGVVVRDDGLSARLDEVGVCLEDEFWCVHERQRRPLRLSERRTDATKFLAHAAVENGEVMHQVPR